MYKLIVIIMIVSFLGCKQDVDETRHPFYLKAEKLRKEGMFAKSAKKFNEYLLLNPKSYKVHRELGTLYNDYLNNYVLAIYHYKKYLQLIPKTEDRQVVKDWIIKSEIELYKELHSKYKDNSLEEEIKRRHNREVAIIKKYNELIEKNKLFYSTAKKYENIILKQKKEISKYKEMELKELKKEPVMMVKIKSGNLIVKSNNSKNYIVKRGDSLMSIANKTYGSTKYYKLIFDANKNSMKNENDLTVGQKLILPEKIK